MSKKLFPMVVLSDRSVSAFIFRGGDLLARGFSRNIIHPKILNWRLPNQTATAADPLLNTDGSTLLNTDGSTLFNTGA